MNRQGFYGKVRDKFGALKQPQVDGFETILAASDGLPRSHRAYLLATAWHETAHTMQPVRETLCKTDAAAVNALERAWKKGQLKWVKTPYWRFDQDGKTWLGRGYVQLTHKDNYKRAAALTGVDLLGDPNKAMQPSVAAKILVEGCEIGMFTGKKLSDYLPGDYRKARRVVNGTDRAAEIAGYAEAFERALQAAGVSEAPTPTKTAKAPQTAQKPQAQGVSVVVGAGAVGAAAVAVAFWEQIKSLFAWLFGG